MNESRLTLWVLWALGFAGLALELAILRIVPGRLQPWYEAQTSLANFVLALLSLVAVVGSFSLRETLALRDLRRGTLDPRTPEGIARLRSMLLVLWGLCLVIGLFGAVLAWGAASPRAAWPYTIAAAVLLVVHAPRRWLFASPAPTRAEAR
jgi:hypothetical protein